MPTTNAPILPSVFDRLLDAASMGTAARGAPVQAVIDAVRRDVEDLLNSRRVADPDVDQYPELGKSVFAYGLPELVSRPAATGPDRVAIGRLLADAIARHEPRLQNVAAVLLSDPEDVSRAPHYRITAQLRLTPAPGVAFDTVVKLSTGQTTLTATKT